MERSVNPSVTADFFSDSKPESYRSGQSSSSLNLVATGSRGLEEVKATMYNYTESVSFALLKQAVVQDRYLILISYIPENVSGLRHGVAPIYFLFLSEGQLMFDISSGVAHIQKPTFFI